MVSFIPQGRMGNFLFQAAASFGYARRHHLDWCVPNKTSNEFWSPLYLQHLIDKDFTGYAHVVLHENVHEYQMLPYRTEWERCNIILSGYFQSEKYFSEYRDEIISTFNYPYRLDKGVCSIHARFGDYLQLPQKHILVDQHYLIQAISHVFGKTGIDRFKVFSDDINYFKNNFGHVYKFEYSSNNSIEQDLIDISCCEHNINSSSTFSWWGSWLNQNENKIIITPKKWFQDGWGGLNTKDIVPDSWIKI